MKPHIGIADNSRHALVTSLNTLLADEYTLYTKTRWAAVPSAHSPSSRHGHAWRSIRAACRMRRA